VLQESSGRAAFRTRITAWKAVPLELCLYWLLGTGFPGDYPAFDTRLGDSLSFRSRDRPVWLILLCFLVVLFGAYGESFPMSALDDNRMAVLVAPPPCNGSRKFGGPDLLRVQHIVVGNAAMNEGEGLPFPNRSTGVPHE